jgi:hypothetical protein
MNLHLVDGDVDGPETREGRIGHTHRESTRTAAAAAATVTPAAGKSEHRNRHKKPTPEPHSRHDSASFRYAPGTAGDEHNATIGYFQFTIAASKNKGKGIND